MSVLLRLLVLLFLAAVRLCAADTPRGGALDPSTWRGFNLLEKFTLRGDAPYREDDFRWIAELGFNFVRLPTDYRCYTERDDWLAFREAALRQIDEAVAFGAKYNVHVCLNLHRAPGFCINPPAEPRDLWTDPVAEAAFVAHWEMFARRYADVPPERLSFNLLNEPHRTDHATYVRVHRRAANAIHAIDPDRPVIVDGNNAGRDPAPELLAAPHVIQATRGYHPSSISHYRASWVNGADTWPVPTWPPSRLVAHLYGPSKRELQSALQLHGPLPAGTEILLRVAELSARAKLQARADGAPVSEGVYDPKLNPEDWRVGRTTSPWVFHEPATPLAFRVRLARPATELAIENIDGDWIRFSELIVRLPDRPPRQFAADPTWGRRQVPHRIDAVGALRPLDDVAPHAALAEFLAPWRSIAARGAPVFVGEWGCYNRTPHAVTLAWMQSWLEQWRQAGFGWALWNFRGSFGVLDSGRTDVRYEDWRGHKLDRDMLTLLQRYARPDPK